jgi:hypothetical protein
MQRMTPGATVDSASPNTKPIAEGGQVTTNGQYRIHTFTQDDANTASMWQSRNGDATVYNFLSSFVVHEGGLMDILIVGGGGGGACMGGGGGAGGYLYYPNYTVTPGTKVVQVGGGGGSEFGHNENQQSRGGNSFFADLVANGGGAGVSYGGNPSTAAKNIGGSGGGGNGHTPGIVGATPAAAGTPGQGHPGGTGFHPGSSRHGGGGGGGAAQAGWPDNPAIPLNAYTPNGPGHGINLYPPASLYPSFPLNQKGGNGLTNDISGYLTHYAGGGGGGSHPGHSNNRTAGGLGGGGEGTGHATANGRGDTEDTLYFAGQPGQRNTGGGGGGGTHSSHQNTDSGRGGPGVVIVRYRSR